MQYIPAWIIGLLSPLFNLIGSKIPPDLKPVVLLGLAAAVVGMTTWLTPLTLLAFPTEMWALFCLVTGAYTLAKPVETGAPRLGAGTVALLFGAGLMLMPLSISFAQTGEPGPGDISGTIASLIGAVLARILRKWFR